MSASEGMMMTSSTPNHAAAGQALGYFHQCMWALVELGARAMVDPAVQLRLEELDDIQFDKDGTPIELLQTKHHTGSSAQLTASTVDLWRTINVWMDLNSTDDVLLRLVTTAIVSDDSELAGLRSGESRNSSAALEQLMRSASESTNQTTEPWRRRFRGLDEGSRALLVEKVVIEDGSPHARDLGKAIVTTFRYAIPPGKEQVFDEMLRGWWAGIAVRLLDRSLTAVSGDDLIRQVADIVDQLKSDTLPVDPAIRSRPDQSITDAYKSRPFVQQLLWIALDDIRLWKAIRDYHRSFTQRSFWLRHQLLGENELDRFAFRLHDEWEQVFDSRVAAMKRDGRVDYQIVGQEILEEIARESRSRLRERFDEPWFNRGMLHALADGELSHQIGWHPEFESKLEAMLADVTT